MKNIVHIHEYLMRQGAGAQGPLQTHEHVERESRDADVEYLYSVRGLAGASQPLRAAYLGSSMHAVGAAIASAFEKLRLDDVQTIGARLSELTDRVTNLERKLAAIVEMSGERGIGRMQVAQDRAGWIDYLGSLQVRAERNELTQQQARAALDFWYRAIAIEPRVMHPTAGFDEGAVLVLSWVPAGLSLVLEIEPNGRFSWFFFDGETGERAGTLDEPEDELPPAFFSFLRIFRRK